MFDSEELMLQALEEGRIVKGDVVVIRYEGPKLWFKTATRFRLMQLPTK